MADPWVAAIEALARQLSGSKRPRGIGGGEAAGGGGGGAAGGGGGGSGARSSADAAALPILRRAAIPLHGGDLDELDCVLNAIPDEVDVVCIGDASHGTADH
jgi:erythromycin esterase-like protein